MVLLISVLLFVTITSSLYLLGVKFWVSPKSVVERVVGEARQAEEVRHPSLGIHEILAKLGNIVPASPSDATLTQRRLYQAGLRSPSALKVFYGLKALSAAIPPALVWMLTKQFDVGGNQIVLIVMSAGVGLLAPGEVLQYLIKRRKRRISRALPNALDLLVVCVESGLGLDQAIIQVSRELQATYPQLSNEFAVTNLEMRHGKRRAEALRNLGERTGIDDMKKLVSTLVQADRFGTSIAQTLRAHADFMRLLFRQRAEEKAAKIGIKLVFPIFFCILPSLFVVTVGPVIVRIFVELLPLMNG
jgi:tight adherence protein C